MWSNMDESNSEWTAHFICNKYFDKMQNVFLLIMLLDNQYWEIFLLEERMNFLLKNSSLLSRQFHIH